MERSASRSPLHRCWAVLLFALTLLPALAAAHPGVYPTGVTLYKPSKAYNGYILFAAADQRTYLIDMDGNVVKRWSRTGFPSLALTPREAGGRRGHLLVQLDKVPKPDDLASHSNGLSNMTIGEVDWNDHVVWHWGGASSPGGGAHQNHDIRRLPEGDTLTFSSQVRHIPGYTAPRVIDGMIEEIDPRGHVVWTWIASRHIDGFGFTPSELRRLEASKDPDSLHINTVVPLGPNRWFDAGDERFAPDNILVNSRNANVAVIIDKSSGKIVWRLGPHYPQHKVLTKRKIPRPVDQLIGEHDVHMIPKGLPGAGNLLIFDNEGSAGYPPANKGVFSVSRVIEVNPQTKTIVWQYTADMSGQIAWMFYSAFIGSARRLPNGNTLIDEGQDGRIFQITPKGEIVWEYISPYFGNDVTNAVYRAQPVDYDWAPAGTVHEERAVHAILTGH